ncbi:MAG: response regulator transcription factor [Firmicutes bacterium]|nr:response regulator transcription factor [Bacillota bacterium]
MKIAIADDNHQILTEVEKRMQEYLTRRGIAAEIAVFDTPQGFIDSLEEDRYDLVIMDIYFDDQPLNGVDAIRSLREKDRRASVVFLTDSSDHMSEAFQVHAFSYIIKEQLQEMLPQVMEDLLSVVTIQRSITLPRGKQNIMLLVDEIVSIETDGHYLNITDVHTRSHRVRMTFSEIVQKLESEKEFLMINKGILVNMNFIRTFENKNAILMNGQQLPARVRGYAAIVRQWHDYNFDKLRGGNI